MGTYVLLSLLVAAGFVATSGPEPARLDASRMPVVDGVPRLLLGLYENPRDDAELRLAVEAGFNLIQCAPDVAELDRVHRLGARAWINTGFAIDLSVDAEKRKAQLAEMVRRFGSHPALLIWEGPDEALWNCWYGVDQHLYTEFDQMRQSVQGSKELAARYERMMNLFGRALWPEFEAARADLWKAIGKPCPRPDLRMDKAAEAGDAMGKGITAGVRALRQMDPAHFIWLNHAPRNSVRAMREHNRAVDMAGCDIYPIPFNLNCGHSDLVNMRPSSVGAYTDRMRDAAPGKACAMVLQGFGWADLREKPDEEADKLGVGRRPTLKEQRFMAWDAIAHGANAIFYWGSAYLKEPGSDRTRKFRDDLCAVARELRDHEAFIVAPTVRPGPSVRVEETFASNDGTGVLALLKKAGDAYALIVVNENPVGMAFTVAGLPAALEGKTLRPGAHGDPVTVRGRAFRDGIAAFDVHVYTVE